MSSVHGKIDHAYSCHCRVGVGLWEALGHYSWGGEAQTEAQDTAGAGSGVPGLQWARGLSCCQLLGHPGAAGMPQGCCRDVAEELRAEWGPARLDLTQG